MESSSQPAQPSLTEVMVMLAHNNINILEVTYVGDSECSEITSIIFEYQWRTTPTSTKWTRVVLPWKGESYNSESEYTQNYIRVLKKVRELRAGLEG